MQAFIDANSFIRMGKPPGGPLFQRLRQLVSVSDVLVLTTSVTITEIARRHAKNDAEHISAISKPHFRSLVKEIFGVDLPEVKKNDLFVQLLDKYKSDVERQIRALNAFRFDVDTVRPSEILDQYHRQVGFFADTGKKDQFPDAFIFEALKRRASPSSEIVVVTDDSNFEAPISAETHIRQVKSMEEFLHYLDIR